MNSTPIYSMICILAIRTTLYEQLNSAAFFTVICPEDNPDILLMAFPLYITQKKSAGDGDATLCFVVKKTALFQSISNTIGMINGDLYVYFGSQYIASSAGTSQPDILLSDQPDSNEILSSRPFEDQFSVLLKVTQNGVL